MSHNDDSIADQDRQLFLDAINGTAKLQQDTIPPAPAKPNPAGKPEKIRRRREIQDPFSDQYEPLLSTEQGLSYQRAQLEPSKLKRLRRGDIEPALLLDLHGLNRQQAKYELLGLIETCLQQRHLCAHIIHGRGQGILKQQLPNWLAQHDAVLAFCQAPRRLGGTHALLVLFDVEDADQNCV